LKFDPTSPLSDRSGGDQIAAYITIDEQWYTKDGVAGQGVIQDLDIYAKYTGTLGDIQAVHGIYAPIRVDPNASKIHTIRNVAVYDANNNGIHFDKGNDKLVGDRLRSEGATGIGMYLAGGDIKLRAIGSVSTGTALKIDGAAVEIDQFDLWRPDTGATTDPTLHIIGGPNGCVLKSGTVSGKTLFKGSNGSNDTGQHYINSKAQFAFVHFKHDTHQPLLNCYFESRSADLVELISCKFGATGYDDISATRYKYLIMISGDEGQQGLVKISGGTGMLRYLGRDSTGSNRLRIDATDHICDAPKLLLFDWGRLGTIEMVPLWAVESSNPLRTHLRCDGSPYLISDQPFAYLNVDAYLDNWTAKLTDSGSFNVPRLPALSSSCVLAIRAIP
jgi:hypothetical protein